jgi:hypothetical protein
MTVIVHDRPPLPSRMREFQAWFLDGLSPDVGGGETDGA